MNVSLQVKRPALRYYGGKWRLAPRIIELIPNHETYVEPYGGAMSVLLRKPPSPVEVYNDLDEEVVNFFRVLREQPEEFMHQVMLTPFSRVENNLAYQKSDNDLERARRLFTRSQQTIGGARVQWSSGWRKQITNNRMKPVWQDMADIAHLWDVIERLKMVQLECRPALEILEIYDTEKTLFYVDPPYLTLTRSDRWKDKSYAHEMTDEDHRALAEALHKTKGMVMLSGYNDEKYRQWYADWKLVEIPARSMQNIPTTECLWIKPGNYTKQLELI
jgi:DNA adenine methylase